MNAEPGPRILIVEDEKALADLLRDYLNQAGFAVSCVHNGGEVVAAVHAGTPDLILLDIMLPGKDGMAVCREVRAFSNVPIIMVTARVEEIDRLLGLELGADDYICKPYSPREVVARVKAVLRRMRGAEQGQGTGLDLDESRFQARIHGRKLALTVVEFQLLKILGSEPGRIYTRAQLMLRIYPDRRVVSDRTIDSHVKKLRRKLAAAWPEGELIHSVYGIGYKFEEG